MLSQKVKEQQISKKGIDFVYLVRSIDGKVVKRREIVERAARISKMLPVKLYDYQFAALVSFSFGVEWAVFKPSYVVYCAKDVRLWPRVPAELLKFTTVDGKLDPQLYKIRMLESKTWRHGYGHDHGT